MLISRREGEGKKTKEGREGGREEGRTETYLVREKVDFGLILLAAARAHLYNTGCAYTCSRHRQEHGLLDDGVDQGALPGPGASK